MMSFLIVFYDTQYTFYIERIDSINVLITLIIFLTLKHIKVFTGKVDNHNCGL